MKTYLNPTRRILTWVIAGFFAAAMMPTIWSAFDSFGAFAIAGLAVGGFIYMRSQRDRMSPLVFAGLTSVLVFFTVKFIFDLHGSHEEEGGGMAFLFALFVLIGIWPHAYIPEESETVLSGPRLIPMPRAQENVNKFLKNGENHLLWGGLKLPERCGTEHFAIVGTPGSGKSLSLQLLMNSVLPRITKGSNRRAVIYDAKRDSYPVILGIFKHVPTPPPIYILNPFDIRASPWQMSKDIRDGASAHQVASILIPKSGKESQPFFIDASRALLGGVIEAFTYLAKDDWTLRDVILTMRYHHRMDLVLRACPQTEYLIQKYLARSQNDIESTLENALRGLSFIAAAWHQSTGPPVSLSDWIKGESIMLLGADPTFDYVLGPLNRALFKRMVELVRRQPEVPQGEVRHTWFIIDELRNAGNLEDLDKLLVEGRSKGACVALGFQDIAGLREVLGGKRADEIVGTCANKVFLQNGEGSTIEYASKHFKSQEILESKVSSSENQTQARKNNSSNVGYSVTKQKVMRPVVHEGLLKSLPKPMYGYQGLAGYCDTALVGTEFPYRMEVTHDFLTANLPKPETNQVGFEERPSEHLTLEEWIPAELKRLGLSGQLKLLQTAPEQPQGSKGSACSPNPEKPTGEGSSETKSVLDF